MKNHFTGATGEFYVAAYLSRKELLVALPRAGVPGSDLFVAPPGKGTSIRVQVKTGTDSKRNPKWANRNEVRQWATSDSIIDTHEKNLWYVFVWLKEWPIKEELPELYFIPSAIVAEQMIPEREELKKNPRYWTYFGMLCTDLEQYKGESGYEKLRTAMDSQITPTIITQIQ